MRLCRFEHNGAAAIGFYGEQTIVPLQAAAAAMGIEVPDCDQITTFLPGGSGRGAVLVLQEALADQGERPGGDHEADLSAQQHQAEA